MKPGRWWILDLFLVITVLGLAGYYLAVNIDLQAAPAEDAAMLMRYAEHFGQGHGIVWNIGEAPVDGATDFLFMVILGGLYRSGIGLEAGVRGLGIAAHFLTLFVVYFGALRMSGGRRWAAWLSAAFLAVGPGLRYSEAAFGTPFFALFVALTWLLAIRASEEPASSKWAFMFAFSSLVTGLIRPEGVLVGSFMMLAVMIQIGFKASRRILAGYLLVNLLLGGAYFLWRWNYFGYPLPNPFYRKGGWDFFGGSLGQAFRNSLNLSGPFWLAYLYGAAVWIWLGLLPLTRLLPTLGKSLIKLAEDLTSEKKRTLSTALRIGLFVCLTVLIIALIRVSSPLHPVLIFGRYSPAYFALLLALLGTAALTWTANRWLLTRLAEDLMRLGKHFQIADLEQTRSTLKAAARQALFLALPAVGYVLMWGLLSDEMNYLGRFQYALVPVILISWPGFFRDFRKAWAGSLHIEFKPAGRAFAGLIIVLLSLFVLQRQYEQHLFTYQKDGRLDAAVRLKEFSGKSYTIATTEAGLLPLYSGWRAVDAWGLNDSWITHHGGIDAAYLDRYQPEVIMFHADFSPLYPPSETAEAGSWQDMVLTLKNYAEAKGYELAAVFGASPRDTHYYYVKQGFPDSQAITGMIRGLEDEGYIFGSRSLNLIHYPRSEND